MTSVDMSTVVPVSEMEGDCEEDTSKLKEQFTTAEAYLRSFKWCHDIKEAYFGDGIGGIVAVFLFRLDGPPDVDEWLWVVSGNLPSCYFVTDEAPTPDEALEAYCELMEDWIEAVRSQKSLDDVYPVDAPATQNNAEDLAGRIGFLREQVLPWFRAGIGDGSDKEGE